MESGGQTETATKYRCTAKFTIELDQQSSSMCQYGPTHATWGMWLVPAQLQMFKSLSRECIFRLELPGRRYTRHLLLNTWPKWDPTKCTILAVHWIYAYAPLRPARAPRVVARAWGWVEDRSEASEWEKGESQIWEVFETLNRKNWGKKNRGPPYASLAEAPRVRDLRSIRSKAISSSTTATSSSSSSRM